MVIVAASSFTDGNDELLEHALGTSFKDDDDEHELEDALGTTSLYHLIKGTLLALYLIKGSILASTTSPLTITIDEDNYHSAAEDDRCDENSSSSCPTMINLEDCDEERDEESSYVSERIEI